MTELEIIFINNVINEIWEDCLSRNTTGHGAIIDFYLVAMDEDIPVRVPITVEE